MRRVIKDEPCIKIRPIENIRFDQAADWMDPVGTSPYFIDIIPMYVCDVKGLMNNEDPKTGVPVFKKYGDDVFKQAMPEEIDTTRLIRSQNGEDPYDADRALTDHDVVWVFKYFMREDDEDYCFYTLGNQQLLTDPVPIEEVYFHGKRPYVIGCCIIETHKPIPEGVANLMRPLQQEANEIANSRLDNVKLVLNKRWFVARGRQVDTASLLRNVPGGVTFVTDPNADVKEVNWSDVTSSAYAEQDRLNVDSDELVGNFSGSSIMTNRQMNETVGGMRMLSQGASVMTEYLIRTWIETWVEPVLRQLMMLEQHYESDSVLLALAGRKSKLFQRFGISQVTDQLLQQQLTLTVNVGQGATDPQQRLQKFTMATNTAIGLINQAPPTANVQEMINEVYSYAGFRNASRFFGQVDPRVPKLMQAVQQLGAKLQGKQMEMQAEASLEQAKLQSNERIKGAEIQVNSQRIQGDLQIRAAELEIQKAELELERLKMAIETQGATQEQQMKLAEAAAKIEEAKLKLEHEAQRIAHDAIKLQAQLAKDERETQAVESNESRLGNVTGQVNEITDQVAKMLQSLNAEMAGMKAGIMEAKNGKLEVGEMRAMMAEMAKGMCMIAEHQSRKKPAMTGYKVQKGTDGKRMGLMVMFEDGSSKMLTEN
jgi:hypothetical protein